MTDPDAEPQHWPDEQTQFCPCASGEQTQSYPYAWSEGVPPPVLELPSERHRPSWVMLTVLVTLIVGVGGAGFLSLHRGGEPAPPTQFLAPSTAPPTAHTTTVTIVPQIPTRTAEIPPTVTVTADPPEITAPLVPLHVDTEFLDMLAEHGISVTQPAVALQAARTICTRRSQGEPEPLLIQDILTGGGKLTPAQATYYVDTAIGLYCPT